MTLLQQTGGSVQLSIPHGKEDSSNPFCFLSKQRRFSSFEQNPIMAVGWTCLLKLQRHGQPEVIIFEFALSWGLCLWQPHPQCSYFKFNSHMPCSSNEDG